MIAEYVQAGKIVPSKVGPHNAHANCSNWIALAAVRHQKAELIRI
jgi:hypothetical protein